MYEDMLMNGPMMLMTLMYFSCERSCCLMILPEVCIGVTATALGPTTTHSSATFSASASASGAGGGNMLPDTASDAAMSSSAAAASAAAYLPVQRRASPLHHRPSADQLRMTSEGDGDIELGSMMSSGAHTGNTSATIGMPLRGRLSSDSSADDAHHDERPYEGIGSSLAMFYQLRSDKSKEPDLERGDQSVRPSLLYENTPEDCAAVAVSESCFGLFAFQVNHGAYAAATTQSPPTAASASSSSSLECEDSTASTTTTRSPLLMPLHIQSSTLSSSWSGSMTYDPKRCGHMFVACGDCESASGLLLQPQELFGRIGVPTAVSASAVSTNGNDDDGARNGCHDDDAEDAAAAAAADAVRVSTSAASNDSLTSLGEEDECIACLSAKKEVVLLPCR